MAPQMFMYHWSRTVAHPKGKYAVVVRSDYRDYIHDVYITSLMEQIAVDKKQ
jgi:hypothetical protein